MSTKEQKVSEEEGLYATIIVGDYNPEEFREALRRWLRASFEREKELRIKRITYMIELINKAERGESISLDMIEHLIKFPGIEGYWTDKDKKLADELCEKLRANPKYKSALELLVKNLR